MQHESVGAVIGRMDQAMRGTARPIVATDADGTLWSGDVGVDAFEALLEGRGVRAEAQAPLAAVAKEAALATTGDANDLAERIYLAFSTGSVDEKRCYELMAWVFAGWTPDEIRSFASRVQERKGLAGRIHAEMQTVVRWAQKRGVELWVVSASPAFVVQAGAARFGIRPDRVIAACTVVRDGRVLPKLSEPIPYGAGKVAAIERVVGPSRVIAAFGDDAFDLEMLLRADVPVAVRPKERLRQRGESVAGLLQLRAEEVARGYSVWPPAG